MPTLPAAGLLLFRRTHAHPEVLLVHPGGPFWAKKDAGSWSIPKGVIDAHEETLAAAKREFTEETGLPAPDGNTIDLGTVTYGPKTVRAWAIEADADVASITSNTFSMEWPPKSGRVQEFAECDRAEWCTLETAKIKLVKGQVPFIDRLAAHVV